MMHDPYLPRVRAIIEALRRHACLRWRLFPATKA